MSHFACGKISFALSPWEGEEAFFFELHRVAVQARINLQLGWAICQNEVSAIIGRLSPHDVAFLMTDSPLSNVSDELIAPDVFTHGEEKCRAIVRQSLDRIRSVLAPALASPKVESAMLALSDGSTTYEEYERLEATLDTLTQTVLNRYEPTMIQAPFIHVRVRRA